jgi:hypothetical protein
MKRSLVVTTALAVLPLLTGNLLADDLPPLTLGSRIRVTTDRKKQREIVGKLVAGDDQSLTLDLGNAKAPVVVPRTAITRVERSMRPSRKADFALAGGVLGLGLAIAAGQSGCGSSAHLGPDRPLPVDGLFCFSSTDLTILAAVELVPLFATIGGLIGRERWKKVPLDRVKVGMAPTRGGGVGAAVSFSF